MKILIAVLMMVFSISARAEWTYIENADGGGGLIKFYIDFDTVKKLSINDVRAWVMASYPKYREQKEKGKDQSYKSLLSYDCETMSSIHLAHAQYSKPMGEGEKLYETHNPKKDRAFAIPDHPGYVLIKKICDKATSIF